MSAEQSNSPKAETFLTLLRAARQKEELTRPDDEVISAYIEAAGACATRAEALYGAARYCRKKSLHQRGYEFATQGLAVPYPHNAPAVEDWIYEYGLLDELAVNAYWTGKYAECVDACDRVLSGGKLPEEKRDRVLKNKRFALDKLAERNRPKEVGASNAQNGKLRSADAPRGMAAVQQYQTCAVVTPYYKEERAVLERCIRSVCSQTVSADHIVVADGFPQDWIDDERVRHIRLDRAHSDYGGTPRAVGCLLAISEQYDAIALVDADNWLEPDHIEHCLETARSAKDGYCDYVIARNRVVRPDGSVMNIQGEPIDKHVDTSCYFFLRGCFHMLPIWGLMPKEASAVGDRFFLNALREQKLVSAVSDRITVNYTSLWNAHYRALGETPPPGAKPFAGGRQITDWIGSLSDRDLEVAERLMRVKLRQKKLGRA